MRTWRSSWPAILTLVYVGTFALFIALAGLSWLFWPDSGRSDSWWSERGLVTFAFTLGLIYVNVPNMWLATLLVPEGFASRGIWLLGVIVFLLGVILWLVVGLIAEVIGLIARKLIRIRTHA
jgi:hypothetical protein